jgi:hypothetical protein
MTSIIKVDTLQKANGATPTAADLGINTTGTVLQGLQGTGQNSGGTVSTTAWTATGVLVTITPASTSSKIYVSGWMHVYKSSGVHYQCNIFRNGTDLLGGLGNGGSDNDSGTAHYDAPIMWIDSPNTTSPVTYEFRIRGRDSSFALQINDSGTYRSNITAIEIAG